MDVLCHTAVVETLTAASSQDSARLKPAESQLKQWETQPGFYTTLFTAFSDARLPVNVRWLAILYFKNGIEKYWRKNAPNAIGEVEKESLRRLLVQESNFREPTPQLATQLAVLVAKIARLDCPRHWPQLIPTLLQGVKCNEDLFQQRTLLAIHHVTKALSSKRLAADRKLYEELTDNIFSYILELWNAYTESYYKAITLGDVTMICAKGEASLLCLKVLRNMITHGFKHPSASGDCVTFVNLVILQTKQFVECKRIIPNNEKCLESRVKFTTTLTKVLYDTQEVHPNFFVQFIEACLRMCLAYNFTDMGEGLIYERFTVNCLNITKNILRCENYKPMRAIDATTEATVVVANKIKMAFFNAQTLNEMCRRLILTYFQLSPDDLHLWDSDPEEFINEEGGDSWKYSLRPCTEVLFLSMLKEFREILTPVLLEMVDGIQAYNNPTDLGELLRKDSVYYAVGLASFDLFEEIDFEDWFTNNLLLELKQKHSNYRIIRRRVVWLIAQWVGVKFASDLRPALYEALLPLMGPDEDLVVRLEAATTLKLAVDEVDFMTDQFLPYLDSSFCLLMELLKEVRECETKMHVLHVLAFLIERVGVHIRPYSSSLTQYLPLLWTASEQHKLLQCAILSTLIHLVTGLGASCVSMYSFLLPVIRYSTDTLQEPHVYLSEDGLELWLVTLCNSPRMTPDLLELYKNMRSLMDLGTETLRTCLKITEAYVLLGGKELLDMFSNDISSSLSSVLSDLRTDGVVLVMKLVEAILRCVPQEGPQVVFCLLPNILTDVLDGDEYPMVMAMYLAIVSRIILQNQPFFSAFVGHFASNTNSKPEAVFDMLLKTYQEKIDNIIKVDHRKVCSLALASLLPSGCETVSSNFAGIINVCVQVLHDVTSSNEETGECYDVLVMHDEAKEFSDKLESEHEKRKRELAKNDPVYCVSLKEYLRDQLTQCQVSCGHDNFQHLMNSVDPEIRNQLQEFFK